MKNSDLITHLEQLEELSVAHADDFDVMRYQLQLDDELDDHKLDALVDNIASKIIASIDCTKCANCCRKLSVYLEPQDIHTLAVSSHVPSQSVLEEYVDTISARTQGEWGVFRQVPCAFLAEDICSVYPHRPRSCRAYPQVTPDFRWVLPDLIEGASICPIIYNMLLTLVPIVGAGIHHKS